MYKGQTILIQKPDNLCTGGQEAQKKRITGLSKGTITGVYDHVIVVDFGAYKSAYRIEDIRLGLERYKEVEQ